MKNHPKSNRSYRRYEPEKRTSRDCPEQSKPQVRGKPSKDDTSLRLPQPLHPGRGILICLGWLRLFQTIVSKDYKPLAKTFAGCGMIDTAS
jgi:hypothetical protein